MKVFVWPGLIVSDEVGAGPLPVAVTTICSLWPAASEPEAGVTARPAGAVIVNAATGPPSAVSVNVPVACPPVAGTLSWTTSGDAARVPRVTVGVGVGLGVAPFVGLLVGLGLGDVPGTGL